MILTDAFSAGSVPGLAAYLNWDPLILRIIFAILIYCRRLRHRAVSYPVDRTFPRQRPRHRNSR
ncbi:MAG: PspC domain-containing protein [Marinilabiliales bacterium]|nr:PspC domain-containing protein [Marinilabiliales bacterium]